MKREKILEAAEELFAEKSYEGTSIRDIAQKAGINIAMISYYFGSKEKLLEALIDYRSSYAGGILEAINKDGVLDPVQKMDRVVDFYVERVLVNHRFHNIMSRQLSMISEKNLREKMLNIKLQNAETIKKIIQEGQRKKMFRKVDMELTIATIIGVVSQVALSKSFYCKIMKAEDMNFDDYVVQIKDRVKTHLKQLIRAHLDNRNAAGQPAAN